MPAYEIARTVRRAGFDPVAPPMREGSIYVVRAADFRGILMRVVVDARSGAIRDASRIVPGPGSYGSLAAMPPYAPMPNEVPVYGAAAEYDGAGVPVDDGEMLPPRPAVTHPLTRANVTVLPPLPRPRPAELAARKADDVKPATEAKAQAKSDQKSEVTGSTAVRPAAAASSSPASEPPSSAPQSSASPATAAVKPGKSLEPPPIND